MSDRNLEDIRKGELSMLKFNLKSAIDDLSSDQRTLESLIEKERKKGDTFTDKQKKIHKARCDRLRRLIRKRKGEIELHKKHLKIMQGLEKIDMSFLEVNMALIYILF